MPLEVWYPASEIGDARCRYSDRLGRVADDPDRPNTAFEFMGRAARDAASPSTGATVVVAHGYPGSRVLLSYLCEHLASTGRVVVAIDHVGPCTVLFATLPKRFFTGRPIFSEQLMQWRVWIAKTRSSKDGSMRVGPCSWATPWAVTACSTPRVPAFVRRTSTTLAAVPNRLLSHRAQGAFKVDPRVRAVVAFAPWGGRHRVWDADGLRGLKVPTLFVAGEDDDVVGWKPGVHTLFAGTSAAERFLLVYEQARHNVAPNPPPTAAASHPMDWGHYAEPIWDLRRLNNTNQHFVRAFGDYALGPRDRLPDALDLTPLAADGEIAVDAQGTATAGTGHWWGFAPRTAIGMQFHRLGEGE